MWALSLAVLLEVLGGAGVVLARGGGRPPAASTGPGQSAALVQTERIVQVRDLLAARAQAVRRHDLAGFLATVDPAEPAFYAAQRAEFDNMRGVAFASWGYHLDPTVALIAVPALAAYGAPTWVPGVQLHYALAGFDSQPVRAAVAFTFVQRHGSWLIGSDHDEPGATQRQLWDFGPVIEVRGEHALVLGHPASLPLLQATAAEVDRDIPVVTSVWGGDWSGRAVVEVPTTSAEFTAVSGTTGDVSRIAAVATAELPLTGGTGTGGTAPTIGDRVILNPPDYAQLSPLGRTVVITHELTHVASRADTGPALPTWLVEGLADYVGYLHSGLPVRTAAQELAAAIAAGRLPAALPPDSAFRGSNSGLAAVYEQAWLACRLIAADAGPAGLVRLYRLVGTAQLGTRSAAQVLAAGVQSVLHESVSAFTRQWRASLLAALGPPVR